MRRFEYRDAQSAKFWSVELAGKSFTVRFGKIGSGGQTQVKEFADEAQAQKEHDKLIAEKLRKGYVEVGTSLRDVLEAAIVANPDDRAAHAAYADLLTEQGDPRGELIAVQLALEDESLPAAQRRRLQARERELLAAHQREWVGPALAPFLLGQPGRYEFTLARGWLDSLHIPVLTETFARALATAPQARLLRSLLIDRVDAYADEESDLGQEELPVEDEEDRALYRLGQSPHLGNVTVLRFGEPVDVDHDECLSVRSRCPGLLHLVRRLPRLEELYVLCRADPVEGLFAVPTLTRLRVLQLYHQHSYPFEVLADNPAFANLTTLLCHAASYGGGARCIRLEDLHALCSSDHLRSLTHLRLRLTELGDEGCLLIVESGILQRLKVLDLNLGSVTDEGARELANCHDLRRLELLDLGRNSLTEAGIAELRGTGVPLRAHDQHDDEDQRWFDIGDIE